MKVYNIPGWKNSNSQHWQSIWERDEPSMFTRINQDDWSNPRKRDWVERIYATLKDESDYAITCHSIGCLAFIHAALKYDLKPKIALFVAPSDPEQNNYPKEITGFTPVPLVKLDFPSIVVASTNDQAVHIERAKLFSQKWDAPIQILGDSGHIDSKDNFGEWPEGRALLGRYLKSSSS